MVEAKAHILIETKVGTVRGVVEALNLVEGVQEVDHVTGPFDIIAIVKAPNLNAIGRLVTEHMHPIPGLSKTITCISMNGKVQQ